MKEEKPLRPLFSHLEAAQQGILFCHVGQCDVGFHYVVIVVPSERHITIIRCQKLLQYLYSKCGQIVSKFGEYKKERLCK